MEVTKESRKGIRPAIIEELMKGWRDQIDLPGDTQHR
jgi:hypothetical protein